MGTYILQNIIVKIEWIQTLKALRTLTLALCQELCFAYNISREPHNSPEAGAADILIEPTGNGRSEVKSISNSPIASKGHLILAKRLRSNANKEQNGTWIHQSGARAQDLNHDAALSCIITPEYYCY